MKKVSLIIFIYLTTFSLYSQNMISNFENEMNEALVGSSRNSWDLNIRIPNSKIFSRLTVGLPGETTSSDAFEIYNNVNELVNRYLNGIDIHVYIGRILHFLEVVEPISLNDVDSSGIDYFDMDDYFHQINGHISDDRTDKIKTLQRIAYRTESPDNTVVGIERKIYVDALSCDYDRFHEIKNLIESDIDIEWLD